LKKERYKEVYDEGSDLLWPSEKEDKVTRQFYKNLSHLTKNKNTNKNNKKLNFFELLFSLINFRNF